MILKGFFNRQSHPLRDTLVAMAEVNTKPSISLISPAFAKTADSCPKSYLGLHFCCFVFYNKLAENGFIFLSWSPIQSPQVRYT